MVSLKVIDPCCHGNQKFGILGILTQLLPQLRRDTVENLAPNRGFSISCEFNNIILPYRLTLVAMVTKMWDKFNTKLAITWLMWNIAENLSPNTWFSSAGNLTCHWNFP